MSYILENHLEKIEILDLLGTGAAGGSLIYFFDRADAAAFLRRYRRHGHALASLRKLLAAGVGGLNASLSNDVLIEKAAARLASGEWMICRTPNPQPTGIWSPDRGTGGAEEPGSSPGGGQTSPPPAEQDEIARDPGNQAAVFEQAARDGSPFCEV